MSSGIIAERIFADLCNERFLRGFVFHSPHFFNPTECEAGDVVLWVRQQVVVFEVVSRDPSSGVDTKQFVKRIGEKRDQLVSDHNVFRDPRTEILLVNQQGEKVTFDKGDLANFGFMGVVIVDFDGTIDKLHFGTIQKSLSLPFPVAVMTRQDFLDMTSEVDTVPDLTYYLHDRYQFLKHVYHRAPQHFLDLNLRLERELIAFYKIHENKFPVDQWNSESALSWHSKYSSAFASKIVVRDAENAESYVIDELIDFLRQFNNPIHQTLLHSWELATMTRRQRATIMAERIRDGLLGMQAGKAMRYFAFFNQATHCWLVFYFQYGASQSTLDEAIKRFTRYKLFVEMKQRAFLYSVFGYGFLKSRSHTGLTVDYASLTIEDASNYSSISEPEYEDACKFFGGGESHRIREFPS